MDDAEHGNGLQDHNVELETLKRNAKVLSRICMMVLFVTALSASACFYWFLNQGARRASCRNDVFVLREYLREYAADHEGLLPPMSPTKGNLMIDPTGFYPEYLENSCWVQCEWSDARHGGHAGKNDDLGVNGLNDDSFCYLPWAMTNEAEGLAFIAAYESLAPDARTHDLTVSIDGKPHVLPRIRFSDAVITKTIDTAEPTFPIAVEWPEKFHWGGTVLYANGEIRTLNMGDTFPMTKNFIEGLHEIASLDGPLSKR